MDVVSSFGVMAAVVLLDMAVKVSWHCVNALQKVMSL